MNDVYSGLTSFAATALTPLEQYRRLVDSGALKADEHQTRIIQRLQRLRDDLVTYDPPPIPSSTPSLSLVCTPLCLHTRAPLIWYEALPSIL